MKSVRTLMIVTLTALCASTLALAQNSEDKPAPPRGEGPRGGRGAGAMLDNLLPPRVLDDLKLTAEQTAKYDELQAAFKKELDKWKSAHPNAADEMRKARDDGDREAMRKLADERKPVMDARKANVDKLRESLTAEQKETLDKELERARQRRGPGGPGGPGADGPKGEKPPPPPPE